MTVVYVPPVPHYCNHDGLPDNAWELREGSIVRCKLEHSYLVKIGVN